MKFVGKHTQCPFCLTHHDTTTMPFDVKQRPQEGDCTLCFRCGEWMFFSNKIKGGLRKPTWPEYQRLAVDEEAIRVRQAWLTVTQGG